MPDPTYFTARLAMLLYAAFLFARIAAPRRLHTARLLYTGGCAVLLVHIAIAFHVHHHWSHTAARMHVEEATMRMAGVASGVGLWLNYAVAALWTADVIYWWSAGLDRYAARRRWVSAALQAFLLFMAFNAAVIFASGTSRIAASFVATVLFIALLACSQRSDKRAPVRLPSDSPVE